MKRHLLFFIVSILSLDISAQNCANYYYLIDNSEVEMTMYDKKGKVSGKNVYKVRQVNSDGNAFNSTLDYTTFDEKGKVLASGEGKFKCNDGNMEIDMRVSMPTEQMTPYKDMEVKAEDAFLNYPANLEEGKTLPDGKFMMEILNNGASFSTIEYEVLNRKVEGKENITTSAGTWDCYKIVYEGKMSIGTMGMKIPVNMKSFEWYSPGFGIVKTETFSKNGKLMGSTVLTGLKK